MRLCALAPLFVLAGFAWTDGGPKRIYLAADDHTDYYWSAGEETYRQAFLEMIDYYLDLADATEKNPPEHQSRWNCDGSFWLWTYEHNKSRAEFERLMRRVRDGHIGVPLNTLVAAYGAMPAEAVLREMYYAGRIERRYGVRFPLAIAMEDQTLPYGLGALWAGAGARYSWKGVCGCDNKVPSQRRPHEVYWWRGPDGSRILMKWNTLLGENKSVGGYAEAYDPAASIALAESDRFRSIYPYRVIGLFGKGWDDLKTLTDEFVRVARASTTPERKVVVSNQVDFFEDMEKTYGKELPEFSASFGNEWDLYPASMPEVLGRVRRSVEGLRAAEALATLVSLERPEFMNGREAARDEAWVSLGLFFEHDWTADSRVLHRATRARWGREMVRRVENYVDSLGRDAAYALGSLIRKRSGHSRFYAFNPLGWARTDIADLPYDGPEAVRVIDLETGRATPSQIVFLNTREYIGGRRHLRVLAKDVPAAGYKVFEIQPGTPAPSSGGPVASGNTVEGGIYRIQVAGNGAVTSLVDKSRGGYEFARALNDLAPGQGSVEVENAGAVSATLKAVANGPVAHTTRITLVRDSRRIDVRNEITENFADVRAWSFTFNLKTPDVWHEEVGAIARAKLAADGGHYWPSNSRLDWLTLNHFADMSGEGGLGVTLSNADCAFMKLGDSAMTGGITKLDTSSPRISVLAGGQVDGPELGIPAQGGDTYFLQRFALQTHGAFDATEAMRFALEHQNPLVTALVTGGAAYPEKSYSLLTVSDPHALLWALKPAEEGIGRGVIARVWNVSPEARSFSMSLATGLASAAKATHIETDIVPTPVAGGALPVSAAPWQLVTYRLVPSGKGRGVAP